MIVTLGGDSGSLAVCPGLETQGIVVPGPGALAVGEQDSISSGHLFSGILSFLI